MGELQDRVTYENESVAQQGSGYLRPDESDAQSNSGYLRPINRPDLSHPETPSRTKKPFKQLVITGLVLLLMATLAIVIVFILTKGQFPCDYFGATSSIVMQEGRG